MVKSLERLVINLVSRLTQSLLLHLTESDGHTSVGQLCVLVGQIAFFLWGIWSIPVTFPDLRKNGSDP